MLIPPDIVDAARKGMAKYHIPASVSIAQWCLESSFGHRIPEGSNNPFGIKASIGKPYVRCLTTEYWHGKHIEVEQRFRKFFSIAEAFELHALLLFHGKPYQHLLPLLTDPIAYAHGLTGVYATDPKYGDKLERIIKTNNLLEYDKNGVGNA